MKTRWLWLSVIALVCFLGPTALAQDTGLFGDDAKPVEADDKATDLMENSAKLIYQLKVEKVALKGAYKIASMMAAEPVSGTFDYLWDGSKGRLNLSDPSQRDTLEKSGLGMKILDKQFKTEAWREQFKGCTLSTVEEVGKSIVKVTGQNEDGIKKLVFGADGIPTEIEIQAPSMPTPGTQKFTYTKVGEQFAPSQMIMEMSMPGLGQFRMEIKYEYTQIESRHVWSKISSKIEMGGQSMGYTVDFTDHKFNSRASGDSKPKVEKGGGW